jgi:putative NADPH-quinone reductase
MKKILIILGHPDKNSFNGALARHYKKAAKKSGYEVELVYLGELKFNPILHKGYKKIQKLEPDLVKMQQKIDWADHLVFIFPTWWYSYPALLKGFIDRTILPGFAFKYKENSLLPLPKRYLKGKTARLITTVDGLVLFYKLFGHSGLKSLKYGVLFFTGVWPVKTLILGSIKKSTKNKRQKWLKKINKLGKRAL